MEKNQTNSQKDIINRLRKEILYREGYKTSSAAAHKIPGLDAIEQAFPGNTIPVGTIHEFLSVAPELAAASAGFITGILASLMKEGGVCLWVSTARTLFPIALKTFGAAPERVIFVDIKREKDILWVMEEALKCEGLAAVIAEVRELSFVQSQRLQLAVEKSNVTGFVLRNDARKLSTTACTARWQVRPVQGGLEPGVPGVGYPRWQVELLKVRNGKPGSWKVEWCAGRFAVVAENTITVTLTEQVRRAG